MKDMDLVIQYAILWGMYIGSAMTVEETENAKQMKQWDSVELLDLFYKWKDEYLKQDKIEDSVDFFNEKLKALIGEQR